jgi:hypothetical protein
MFRSLDRGLNWTQLLPPKKAAVKKPAARSAAKSKVVAKKTSVTTTTAPVVGLIPALGEKIKILARTEDGKNGILAGTDKGIYAVTI